MNGKKRKDLSGMTFNKLLVLRENGKTKSGDILWLCQCSCENKTITSVTSSNLQRSHTQSCGCIQKENISKAKRKYNNYDLTGEYGIGYTSKGEEFYFDLEDYEKIKSHCWFITKNGYVTTHKIKGKIVSLHRYVLNQEDSEIYTDHINGVKYDNRKLNLRKCNQSQNQMNKEKQTNNTSTVVGVSFSEKYKKWRAYITINKKRIELGYFEVFNNAVFARKQAEKKYFKEYSYDNSRRVNNELFSIT